MSAMLSIRVDKNIIVNAVRMNGIMDNAPFIANVNSVNYHHFENTGLEDKTSQLIAFIDELKMDLILTASKENQFAIVSANEINQWKVKGMDNQNVSQEIMFGKPSKAYLLKTKIDDYREYLTEISNISETESCTINRLLSTNDIDLNNRDLILPWESYYFDHLPLAVLINNLTQLENKIRLAEGEAFQLAKINTNISENAKNLGLSGLSNVGSLLLQFTWRGFFR